MGKRFVLKFETLFEYLSPDRKFVTCLGLYLFSVLSYFRYIQTGYV